ncbi:Uncharacterised protein [Burkholderia pseudomallei]|nr:Uncharacterised protein [Burkholderia pseudomallei]
MTNNRGRSRDSVRGLFWGSFYQYCSPTLFLSYRHEFCRGTSHAPNHPRDSQEIARSGPSGGLPAPIVTQGCSVTAGESVGISRYQQKYQQYLSLTCRYGTRRPARPRTNSRTATECSCSSNRTARSTGACPTASLASRRRSPSASTGVRSSVGSSTYVFRAFSIVRRLPFNHGRRGGSRTGCMSFDTFISSTWLSSTTRDSSLKTAKSAGIRR